MLAIYEYPGEQYQVEDEVGAVYAICIPSSETVDGIICRWIVLDPTLQSGFDKMCQDDPGLVDWLEDDAWPSTEEIVKQLVEVGYDAIAGWVA